MLNDNNEKLSYW